MKTIVRHGFTIVELLIVIVVIAILATITIIGYNGITNQALETSIKSDLKGGATLLENDKVTNGQYPVAGTGAGSGQGIRTSSGNTYTYNTTPNGYCLQVVNGSRSFNIKSTNNQITSGPCVAITSTYAGGATSSYIDATGTAARFNGVAGLAADNQGNVYVADRTNNRIRKIASDGAVTTYAGSGGVGACSAGTGTGAVIPQPVAVATDTANNLYVAAGNSCILKITPARVVTIIGGGGGYGANNGASGVSQFRNPSGVAVDNSGNVYVVDRTNYKIRVISPLGVASDFVGSGTNATQDGTGAAAQFSYPDGIAIDRNANFLYVSESSHKIRKVIISSLSVSTFAGGSAGYADGTGTAAQFSYPVSLTADWAGNIYVTEQDNSHRIRKITPSGVVTTLAGNGTAGTSDGTATAAQFYYPWGITIDTGGNLYVGSDSTVRKIDL